MVTLIRQLFRGSGAQMVTTLLAVDVVRRGGESYPSPFAYDLAVIAIVALCVGAILLSFLLPRTIEPDRSEEHTSELQSLMRISYAVFCLKKKIKTQQTATTSHHKVEQSSNSCPTQNYII